MTVFNTLITSLILAILTGITIVAYKHPKGYKNLLMVITPLIITPCLFIVAVAAGAFHQRIITLYEQLKNSPDKSIHTINYIIVGLYKDLQLTEIILVILIISLTYLTFLFFLPVILGIKKGQE